MRAIIIDDEQAIRDSLQEILVGYDLQVVEAENVEQAKLGHKCKGPFDLHIVDLLLPGAHGTCYIEYLPVSERKKVLVMSACVDDNVYWMCEHLQLIKRQILPKPFDLDCLRVKIEEILQEGEIQIGHNSTESKSADSCH